MNAFSFSNVQTAPAKASRAKKSDKVTFEIDGLEELARVTRVRKALEALEKTMAEEVKNQMADRFVEIGMEKGARPENFTGVEGVATASCELRIRASSSPVNGDEAAILKDFDIGVEEIEEQQEHYYFDNTVLADPVKRAKIEKALSKAGLTDNIILKQEARVRYIVPSDALDKIFSKIKESSFVKRLVGICGVLAIKPKISEPASASFTAVQNLIADEAA